MLEEKDVNTANGKDKSNELESISIVHVVQFICENYVQNAPEPLPLYMDFTT